MLASNYLTADALHISVRCRAALIRLLRKLECDEITNSDFNMESLRHCFYGHCQRIDPGAMPRIEHLYGGLLNLCFPFDCTPAFGASRSQGAHALRNFLVAGRADWPAVMRVPRHPNLAKQWRVRARGNFIEAVPAHEHEAA